MPSENCCCSLWRHNTSCRDRRSMHAHPLHNILPSDYISEALHPYTCRLHQFLRMCSLRVDLSLPGMVFVTYLRGPKYCVPNCTYKKYLKTLEHFVRVILPLQTLCFATCLTSFFRMDLIRLLHVPPLIAPDTRVMGDTNDREFRQPLRSLHLR